MDNLEAWSFGGSIITFLIPMLAFAAVMLALLVLGTKPELVPGRRGNGLFPVTATREPGLPQAAPAEPAAPAAPAQAAETDKVGKAE